MNWAEVSALAGAGSVIFIMLSALFSWIWNHGTRLSGVEIKIKGLEKQHDQTWAEIRAQLVRIEFKLDRSIEREITDSSNHERS